MYCLMRRNTRPYDSRVRLDTTLEVTRNGARARSAAGLEKRATKAFHLISVS